MNAPSITTTAQTNAVSRNFDLAAAFKDALKAALITLGLSIPILAYKTDQSGADLCYLLREPELNVIRHVSDPPCVRRSGSRPTG